MGGLKRLELEVGSAPTSQLHPCPDCDGEAALVYVGGPGYYDSAFGNYLPSETLVECERCEGAGEIEAPTCPGCSGPMDDDPKWWHGDPYCPACKLQLSEFFEEGAAA
jgi:hypothetical protein